MTLLGQKDCKPFSIDNCVRNRGMKNVLCTKRAEKNNRKRRSSLSWKVENVRLKIQRNEHTRLSRKRRGRRKSHMSIFRPREKGKEEEGPLSHSPPPPPPTSTKPKPTTTTTTQRHGCPQQKPRLQCYILLLILRKKRAWVTFANFA